MAYEVEMKAWVDDWPRLEAYLRRTCTYIRRFRKSDRYFRAPSVRPSENATAPRGESAADRESSRSHFRVRMDDSVAAVTFKDRSVRDDAEINLEREITVSDAAGFIELMERMGCEATYEKIKDGLHFTYDGLTVELVHVRELGDFLEVEFVDSDSETEEAAYASSASRIRAFIERAGIDASRIERQQYRIMLGRVRAQRATASSADR